MPPLEKSTREQKTKIRMCQTILQLFFKKNYAENNSTRTRSVQKYSPPHLSKKRSAKSGTQPSVPDHTSLGPTTSEAAKERPQETANIRIHRRRQAKCAERRGESRAFADGKLGSLLDGQTHGKDFDCPLVPRLHGNVHVPEFHISANGSSRFAAYSRQCPFRRQRSHLQTT